MSSDSPDMQLLHEIEAILPYTWRSNPDFERVLHDIVSELPWLFEIWQEIERHGR